MPRRIRPSDRNHSPAGCLVIFAVMWSAFVIGFDAFLVVNALKQERAKSYPTTTGVVVSSEVESHTDSDGTTYSPLIVYRYEVNGVEHTNDRYRYGMWSTNDHGRSSRIVKDHPLGEEITVYYNPEDPQDALLTVGAGDDDVGLVIFLTPFNLAMIFLWMGAIGMLWRHFTNAPAGGVKIRERGGMTIVRLPRCTPLLAGAGTALAVSFAGVFIVSFTMGSAPPVMAATILLGVSFGAGLIVMWQRMWVIGSGAKDLILDPVSRTLTLPRSFGRTGDETRGYDDVERVDVEVEITKSSDSSNKTRYFLPTIYWRGKAGEGGGGGSAEKDHLAKWMEARRAEQFVDWLAQQLNAPRGEISDAPDDEEREAIARTPA